MALSSRDRISVDLQGLKAALWERAQAVGAPPSAFVRQALSEALGEPDPRCARWATHSELVPACGRVRLSLRMSREQVSAIFEGAHHAGMSPGNYVAGLVSGVPAMMAGGNYAEYVAVLVASSAELSTLSRNIHHLTSLLSEGAFRPAQEYRATLQTLADKVRNHLTLASRVLADLRPRSASSDSRTRRNRRASGESCGTSSQS